MGGLSSDKAEYLIYPSISARFSVVAFPVDAWDDAG